MNKSKVKKAVKNVQLFHEGELVLKYNLQSLNIKNGIDWEYMHPSSASTYQVYLHSLTIVNDFTIVGTQTRKKKELESGRSVILDWYSKGKSSEFAWHEHAVSARLLNIIYFQESAEEFKLDREIFQEILIQHCSFLNDEKNYKHNNHGLMMDNALITASNYIEDEKTKEGYINKALFRIRTSIYRDLTRQGLHVENSPEYHNLYIILLNQIFETLKKYDIKLESNINYLRESAIQLRSNFLKPNHEFPLIGDTGQTQYKSVEKTFNNIVDLEAGLVVLQNENMKKRLLSRYFTFKCGYISKTHKHNDDLSITYFNKGHDVIIDPGKYSYNKDEDREYIISPQAHSTIALENETYPLLQVGQRQNDQLRITKYFYNDDYHLVEGINHLYDNTEMRRTCIVTKEDDLIILDHIIQKNDQNVMQLFNINEHAEINQNEGGFDIKIDKTNYVLQSFKVDEGLELEILDGFISKEFGKKIYNKRLCFKKCGNNVFFATLLKNQESKTVIEAVDNNHLKLKMEERTLIIPL